MSIKCVLCLYFLKFCFFKNVCLIKKMKGLKIKGKIFEIEIDFLK